MNTNAWAQQWAADEDAEFLNPEATRVLREIVAEGMADRVRAGQPPVHMRDLYTSGCTESRIYGFGGPVRRGFVAISEGGCYMGATVAGNGTPAAVWQAGEEDRDIIVAVMLAHAQGVKGSYVVFSY